MKKDKIITVVIFRKFKSGNKEIIALFPELPGTNKWYADCMSYMHVGQHGAASVDLTVLTQPASPVEYADLKRELEGLGYDLKVELRFKAEHLTKRKQAVERVG